MGRNPSSIVIPYQHDTIMVDCINCEARHCSHVRSIYSTQYVICQPWWDPWWASGENPVFEQLSLSLIAGLAAAALFPPRT